MTVNSEGKVVVGNRTKRLPSPYAWQPRPPEGTLGGPWDPDGLSRTPAALRPRRRPDDTAWASSPDEIREALANRHGIGARDDVACTAAADGGIFVTYRHLGAHCLLAAGHNAKEWRARIWRIPSGIRHDGLSLLEGRNLLPILYAFGRDCDKGLQDLAIACLNPDAPDYTAWLRPPSNSGDVTVREGHEAGGLAVLTELQNAIVLMYTERSLAAFTAQPGISAVGLVAVRDGGWTRLVGELHGYRWSLQGGYKPHIAIAPPGHDPIAAPWWVANVEQLPSYDTDRDGSGSSAADVADLVRDLFAVATPAPYNYWFAETYRGKGIIGDYAPGITPDGRYAWRGRGMTASDGYHEAHCIAYTWSRVGHTHARRRKSVPAGDPYTRHTRQRDRKPRRPLRITVATEPLWQDPRDFTAWPTPADILLATATPAGNPA